MTANSTGLRIIDGDVAIVEKPKTKQPHQAKDVHEAIDLLADCTPILYESYRKDIAKEWGLRPSVLDAMVTAKRKQKLKADDADEDAEWHVEPAEHAVDGADLANNIEALIAAHIILPKGAVQAITMWILHTWAIEAAKHTPRLALLSPEPECGKTTAFEVVLALCHRPEPADNITSAGMYYAVKALPGLTMGIDEMDSMEDGGEACRNVINSGHRRGGKVRRVEEVGGERQLVSFNTFCPVLIASIGKLKATIMSRSIVIWLRRKRADEQVKRLEDSEAEFSALLPKIARWSADNTAIVKAIKPTMPETLGNRAADNWRELYRIAEVIGGGWPEKLTEAAVALLGARKGDTATNGTMLLVDIRSIFEAEHPRTVLPSELIVDRLVQMETRPWPEMRAGKPLTTRQLAGMLDDFDIVPKQHRDGGRNVRGYELAQFLDVFERYTPDLSATALQPASNLAFMQESHPLPKAVVADSKTNRNPHEYSTSSAVADKVPPEAINGEHKATNGERDYNTDPLGDDEFDVPPLDPDDDPFKIPGFLDRSNRQ